MAQANISRNYIWAQLLESPTVSLCKKRLSLLLSSEFWPKELTMEGEEGTQEQQLVLANKLFLLTHNDVDDIEKVRLRDEVFNFIVTNGNRVLQFFFFFWKFLDVSFYYVYFSS